jgi:hypothetical protein
MQRVKIASEVMHIIATSTNLSRLILENGGGQLACVIVYIYAYISVGVCMCTAEQRVSKSGT